MLARRTSAHYLIVSGFAVTCLATLSNLIVVLAWDQFTGDTFETLKGRVESFFNPLSTIAAIIAWWYLSKIFVNGTDRRRLARLAFGALALQFAFVSALYVFVFLPLRSVSLENTQMALVTLEPWALAIGSCTTTIGFFLMMSTYREPRLAAEDAP